MGTAKVISGTDMTVDDDKLTTRGDQRRKAIVEAATTVFLEAGFAGATLDMIIERSGGSRRTIYEHFGSKEGLFSAVLSRCCERVMESVTAIDIYALPPREALTVIGEQFLRAITDPVNIAIYRAAVAEVVRFPEIGHVFYTSGLLRGYARLAEYLRRKVAAGELQIRDTDVCARQFMEMIKSDLHFRCIFYPGFVPSEAEIRSRVTEAVETTLKGAV